MTQDYEQAEFSTDEPAWGKASDRRGVGRDDSGISYAEHAKQFVTDKPIGTSPFSAQVFDEWLQARGLLVIPSTEASKNSDAWLGHLQRRHIIRSKINKAATHPRLTEMGSTPFIIAAVAGGFEVRAPHVAIGKSEIARRITTLTETKQKQLAYLMQSADWTQLPAHERSVAEVIYDDIEALAQDTRTSTERISKKLVKLEQRIKAALDSGSMVARNHGFQRLLETHDPEDLP